MPIPISSSEPALVGTFNGRLRFPSTDDRLVYESPGPNMPLYSRAGVKVKIYSDAGGSVLADIVDESGTAIPGAELTVNNDSQIPQFFGPVGVEVLYARAAGGTAQPIFAWLQGRYNDLNDEIATLQTDVVKAQTDATLALALDGEVDAINAALVSKLDTATASSTYVAKTSQALNILDYGASPAATAAANTAAIQEAIQTAALSGRPVYVPAGIYALAASTLAETFDNDGTPRLASTNCLVLRKGVSIFGDGPGLSVLSATDRTLSVLAVIAPEDQSVQGLSITNAWSVGLSGAGHGILVLSPEDGLDRTCRNFTCRDLFISGVGSYGIGLQQGSPTGCRIESVEIENTGADGLDLKARSDVAAEPSGNFVTNVHIRNHGQRVEGSAGIDIRGVWHLSGIAVTDFGGNNNAVSYLGIRFRTKPVPGDAYNKAGAHSSLTGFYIRSTAGATPLDLIGVTSGSDYVQISNGSIDGCREGVLLSGNANGSATQNKVHGVTVANATAFAFRVSVGCLGTVLSGCSSLTSAVGFRDEAGAVLLGCISSGDVTPRSTSSAALVSQVVVGCTFDNEQGVSVTSAAVGRVNVSAVGPSANIDITLTPKGTGLLRYGAHTANADAAISGYVTIRTADGVTRKLAVIT